jgi:hypothetical protein
MKAGATNSVLVLGCVLLAFERRAVAKRALVAGAFEPSAGIRDEIPIEQ